MNGEAGKLTTAQVQALRTIARRSWPAGEPRRHWIGLSTVRALEARGLVQYRPDPELDHHVKGFWFIELSPAGRTALSSREDGR